MIIEEVTKYSSKVLESLNLLIPQLTASRKEITENLFRQIIADEDVHLFVGEEDQKILGSLTLVMYPIPTDLRVVVEDVVVDRTIRGKGVGQLLMKAAIEKAKQKGATSVNLTSNPSREAANALYQKMGFVQRETNVYRYDI